MSENERIMFDNNFLNMQNQNLEEAEELEDRRRREEEIHNLLTHAMGDFNYDDQSTINTTIASEEDTTSIALPPLAPTQTDLAEQYREANADDQLRVLYEVRVREVMELSEQVEKLQIELAEQEKLSKKKVTLLGIENEQKGISLKEAQNLLVDKTEHIQQLNAQLEGTKLTTKNLEAQIAELNDEKFVLQQLNMDLEQQVAVMERRFPLHNTPSDKQLQESLRNKIAQLESSLSKAVEQIEQKDKQHKELVKELMQGLEDKDNYIAEKNVLINNLTENFDHTQRNCQDLQKAIDELTEKRGNSRTESPLEEEIRKIREHNERTDILCDNVKKAVSTEFQEQIAVLNSENKVLKEATQQEQQRLSEMINQVSKEKETLTEKLIQCQEERDFWKQKYDTLTTDYENQFKLEKETLTQKLHYCEKDRDSWKHKCDKLTEDHDLLITSEKDNEHLKKRISDLESYIKKIINRSVAEKSVQVSAASDNSAELTKLQDELASARDNAERFENAFKVAMQENTQLKCEVQLEKEREHLIEKLQEKAAEFEKIIFKKQESEKSFKPKTISVATNTGSYNEDKTLLQLKYDAILCQREIEIREEIRHEFDKHLEKFLHEYNEKLQTQICKQCDNLKAEVKNLTESREHDRRAIVEVISLWEHKFADVEKKSEEKITAIKKAVKAERDQYTVACLEKIENTYEKKCTKMSEHLKLLGQEIKREKELLVQANIYRYNILHKKLNRIASKLRQGDDEIHAAEKKFSKAKSALKKK